VTLAKFEIKKNQLTIAERLVFVRRVVIAFACQAGAEERNAQRSNPRRHSSCVSNRHSRPKQDDYGPVKVIKGKQKGKVGYYDDDEGGYAIVYFGEPFNSRITC
jgi:hypothetical protein